MGRRAARFAGIVVWIALCSATALVALAFLPTLIGFETQIVASGSMGRTMPVGSVALTRDIDGHALSVGDVVSFRHHSDGLTTTHRIASIENEGSRVVLTTRGDANAVEDPEPVVVDGRIHRVEFVVPFAGHLVRYARTPWGGVVLILVPLIGLTLDRSARGRRGRRTDPGEEGWSATTFALVQASSKTLGTYPGG